MSPFGPGRFQGVSGHVRRSGERRRNSLADSYAPMVCRRWYRRSTRTVRTVQATTLVRGLCLSSRSSEGGVGQVASSRVTVASGTPRAIGAFSTLSNCISVCSACCRCVESPKHWRERIAAGGSGYPYRHPQWSGRIRARARPWALRCCGVGGGTERPSSWIGVDEPGIRISARSSLRHTSQSSPRTGQQLNIRIEHISAEEVTRRHSTPRASASSPRSVGVVLRGAHGGAGARGVRPTRSLGRVRTACQYPPLTSQQHPSISSRRLRCADSGPGSPPQA